MTYNDYNKKFRDYARKNRNFSTKAEIKIWCELLRNKNMMGYQFLRQRPVLHYIADFMCKELMLIIEVDGITHDFKVNDDKERDRKLKELGYTTLRFTDNEIMENLYGVEECIRNWIFESSPCPLRKGDSVNFIKSKIHKKVIK